MEIANTTPLLVFVVAQVDRSRRERTVVLARGVFPIGADPDAEPCSEQSPFTLVDEYYGDPRASSLRRASEISYAKPRADIYFIDPLAVPPRGDRAAEWPVMVRVGELQMSLQVTGPRVWYRSILGSWTLSEPAPCSSVEVRFEDAYGGSWTEGGGRSIHAENPVGVGHVAPDLLRKASELPAPRVYDPARPPQQPNLPCPAVGLTPVSPAWQPRLSKAGTYDRPWLDADWPNLPSDFTEAFFNCAPAALQYPGFPLGGEAVEILGLGGAPLRGRLPRPGRPMLHVYAMDGSLLDLEMKLDTIVFDLSRQVVELLWRASFVPEAPVFFAQLRLMTED